MIVLQKGDESRGHRSLSGKQELVNLKLLYIYDHTYKDVSSFSSNLCPHFIENTIVKYL